MLDSLSFLHSSPPVFSSANTVNPSFLFLFFRIPVRSYSEKTQTPVFFIHNIGQPSKAEGIPPPK